MDDNQSIFYAPSSRPILALAIHPNEKWLAVGQISGRPADPTLSIIELQTGNAISILEKTEHNEGSVYKVIFHPDAERIFYIIQIENEFELRSFHLPTQKSQTISRPGIRNHGFACDISGEILLSLGDDLHIWQKGHEKIIPISPSSESSQICMALSPDGKNLALGGFKEGHVSIFDLRKMDILLNLPVQYKEIGQVNFNRTSQYIGALNEYGRGLYIWDIQTGARYMDDLFSEELALTSSFCFSPATDHVMVGHVHNYVVIYDYLSGDEILADHLHDGRVEDVCISPSGRLAISGGEDSQIVVRKLG